MKKVLFTLLLLPLHSFSQLQKKINNDNYVFTDIPVMVENGHGEKVKVLFSAIVPIKVWKQSTKPPMEKDFFELIAGLLSTYAQYTLDNTLSFEPLKKQDISYDEEKGYICKYKMMGRNGLGNMVETSAVVNFNPHPKD